MNKKPQQRLQEQSPSNRNRLAVEIRPPIRRIRHQERHQERGPPALIFYGAHLGHNAQRPETFPSHSRQEKTKNTKDLRAFFCGS